MTNQITVVGNLTREPELRYTPTGSAVVKFGLAVNRSYTNRNGEKVEQTDFFNVVAWRQLGENIAESLKVGARVIVTGRLSARSWETEDHQKRNTVEIEADEVGPSLRWATAAVTKAARGGPGEWHSDNSGGGGEAVPYGAPALQGQPQPQYGAPAPQYGAPAQQPQYGAPAPQPQYGAPSAQPNPYGAPNASNHYGAVSASPQEVPAAT